MSRIFIDRPIFAWVLAIIVMLAGIGAFFSLPIEQYPDIAPTNVKHDSEVRPVPASAPQKIAPGGPGGPGGPRRPGAGPAR